MSILHDDTFNEGLKVTEPVRTFSVNAFTGCCRPMRLINAATLRLEDYLDDVPPYAILSHTWGDEEVSFQDISHPTSVPTAKAGYSKIVESSRLARQLGHKHIWIDTCCIDKTSSAELTESINSMFRWYKEAQVCLAYLSDLESSTAVTEDSLGNCRWFTRGWTLQELLAPRALYFYDRTWTYRGTKEEYTAELSAITGIQPGALQGTRHLSDYSVATRMSWAAHRKTTRLEDTAYALLGIFDTNLPLIYGEGSNAFRRLQEEIVKRSNDMTIFAWEANADPAGPPTGKYSDLFAPSPAAFLESKGIQYFERAEFDPEFAITNKGLQMEGQLTLLLRDDPFLGVARYSLRLGARWTDDDHCFEIGIPLCKVGPSVFVREANGQPLTSLGVMEREAAPLTTLHRFFVCADRNQAGVLEQRAWDGAVRFYRGPAAPAAMVAIPETHWDRTKDLFFVPRQRNLVFAATMAVTLSSFQAELVVLIDHRTSIPTLRIFSAAKYPRLQRWLFRHRHAAGSMTWSDIDLDLGELPELSDKITILASDKAFYVTALLVQGVVESNSGEADAYYVKVEVDEGSRYSLGSVKRLFSVTGSSDSKPVLN